MEHKKPWSLAEGKLRPLAEGGRRPRALHFGGRMSEIWIQCFSCCITDEPPPKRRHRIDRSMIGSPTNFRHTAHVGSGDMNVHSTNSWTYDEAEHFFCQKNIP
ncbi:hypothetical protein AVEN_2936-1 [Araneus ventricosus]|uniref:CRIB domain-containing protein n=1 Tax=Araneus ventricosus TaxID=182803 RepID=A0A4Y1ZTV0_ARAVE|nr:hypothetical protein AVEN_2936-1 [Araneus ventricosus]